MGSSFLFQEICISFRSSELDFHEDRVFLGIGIGLSFFGLLAGNEQFIAVGIFELVVKCIIELWDIVDSGLLGAQLGMLAFEWEDEVVDHSEFSL